MLEYLFGTIADMSKWLWGLLVQLWDFILTNTFLALGSFLDLFSGLAPGSWLPDTGWAGSIIGVANVFFPVDTFFLIVETYFAFVVGFFSIKMILKLIPTIG